VSPAVPGAGTAETWLKENGFSAGLFGGLPGREGWRCYVASIGGEAVACAAMPLEDRIAQFGIAPMREAARGHGCQLGLLCAGGSPTRAPPAATRSSSRRASGSRAVPRTATRNILGIGFVEAYLRPNWGRAG
jgi:hypothetical protein